MKSHKRAEMIIRDRIYELTLRGFTQQEIADSLQIDQSTVSKQLKKIRNNNDYCLSTVAAQTFVQQYFRGLDYLELNKKRLEMRLLTDEVMNNPELLLKYVRELNAIQKDITFFYSQGAFMQEVQALSFTSKPPQLGVKDD